MSVVTRFAPSPTGLLHVGNVRTALIAWLFARSNGGKFILRIDDTDQSRSEDQYVDGIQKDLRWLGLDWDEMFFQSSRIELYEEAKQRLIADGRLYPCYETPEELSIKKKTLLSRNLPPIYDRAALKLTSQQHSSFEEQGIKAHWRFLLDDADINWEDGIRGKMHFIAANLSDPVLFRADGTMTYNLASVVDDIKLGITHIIRGEDHLSNSATHIQLFKALGAPSPQFIHTSLLSSKDKEISKRLGGFDIESLRNIGMEPMAINSFLAKLGSSDSVEYRLNLNELIKEFDLKKFSKAPANYDQADLERLNTKLLHHLDYSAVVHRLRAEKLDYITEEFWEMARGNINTLGDIAAWWKIYNGEFEIKLIDQEFTNQISVLLPPEPWDGKTWDNWIASIKQATARSGSPLFMPIRLAITGQETGPELRALLPILGRQKVLARLLQNKNREN